MRPPRRAPSNASVDLDRYAEITAHLRHFPDEKKDEVVARLGVRPHDWQAASARWAQELEASLESGRADLTDRYSAAFTRSRRRLSSLRPAIESLGPLPEPEPEPAEVAAPAPPPEPASPLPPPPAEAKVAVPSFMSSPVQESAPDKPSFMHPAPWAAPQPPPPLAPPDAAEPTTAEMPAPAFPKKGYTATMPVLSIDVPKLPFNPPELAPEKAIERAIAHARTVQGPPPVQTHPLGSTMEGTFLPAAMLPFGKTARPIPEYTVERYASLRVELHEYADRAGDVLARYQLDRETCNALDDDWKNRFKADPMLRSRFLDACERYKVWLRSRDTNKR